MARTVKTMAEIRAEREREERRVYAPKNKYGYEISVGNPVLYAWYKRYCKKIGNVDGTEPWVRLQWEQTIKDFIRKEYRKYYKCQLREPVMDWVEREVEEMILAMGADYGKEL